MKFVDVAFTLLCAVLFWASFSRCVHTSSQTRSVIRASFCVQGSVSIAAGSAPWVCGYQPDWLSILLLASMVFVQLSTSLLWRAGVPAQFLCSELSVQTSAHIDDEVRHA